MNVYLVIIAVVSYLLGSIPFGYILVRVFLKQDIRTTGSGNIGATNVGRTGHKGLAIATLLLDAGKGALAVLVGLEIARAIGTSPMDYTKGYPAVAALCAVMGHLYPIWLRFKGGKGVATAAGALAMISPYALAASVLSFVVVVAISRYVSLGSIVAAVIFPVAFWWIAESEGGWRLHPHMFYIAPILIAILVISKHHANIRRLLSGTENKLGSKSKLPGPQQMERRA